jgi:hypothetical protein
LQKVTLIFTNVPLARETSSIKEDNLVLLVGEVLVHGARGDPALRMEAKGKTKPRKRCEFFLPYDDFIIREWVNGLRARKGLVKTSFTDGMGLILRVSL